MNRTRVVVAVLAAGLASGVHACTPAEPAKPRAAVPPPKTAPAAPRTQPDARTEEAKRKATAAYVAMWQDVAAAARTSNWRSPRLAQHATGDALRVLSRQLYADHYNGVVTQGRPLHQPVVESVTPATNPTTVMIRDCSDDSTWLKYHQDTGKRVDDKPGGQHLINAEVKLAVDGSWRVTRFAVQGTGSC